MSKKPVLQAIDTTMLNTILGGALLVPGEGWINTNQAAARPRGTVFQTSPIEGGGFVAMPYRP